MGNLQGGVVNVAILGASSEWPPYWTIKSAASTVGCAESVPHSDLAWLHLWSYLLAVPVIRGPWAPTATARSRGWAARQRGKRRSAKGALAAQFTCPLKSVHC